MPGFGNHFRDLCAAAELPERRRSYGPPACPQGHAMEFFSGDLKWTIERSGVGTLASVRQL